MRWLQTVLFIIIFKFNLYGQSFKEKFDSLKIMSLDSGVTLTIDEPQTIDYHRPTKIIVYALPNGNTTAQTFGKRPLEDEDWHFDIQHIGAQTAFIRHIDPHHNYIVVYAANTLNSWPAWRRKYADSEKKISDFVTFIYEHYKFLHPRLTLCGHSGGGSFIFSYLNAQSVISPVIERIGFLDATYNYETAQHKEKLNNWLKSGKHALQVIAYNDSVVQYNGKALVSPTGGTWYRSQLMAKDLLPLKLRRTETEDRLCWGDTRHLISIKLIKNPNAQVLHTLLVEKNGLIDLLFSGTRYENAGYTFWGDRAYDAYILR